ncbi:MAG: hypothetical protein LBH25_10560, partial [Fibromonadaceae bacterium]|nr:hypothetical protein [Fibromonadaceae bacterium]
LGKERKLIMQILIVHRRQSENLENYAMLNKIYPIFVFFYAGLCYAQQAKNPVDYQQKKDSIDYFCERYESVYSVLSNLDSSLGTRLSEVDSLFQIVIIEGEKLKREICFNYYCIDGCYNIG